MTRTHTHTLFLSLSLSHTHTHTHTPQTNGDAQAVEGHTRDIGSILAYLATLVSDTTAASASGAWAAADVSGEGGKLAGVVESGGLAQVPEVIREIR